MNVEPQIDYLLSSLGNALGKTNRQKCALLNLREKIGKTKRASLITPRILITSKRNAKTKMMRRAEIINRFK